MENQNPDNQLQIELKEEVAQGGCLGTKSR